MITADQKALNSFDSKIFNYIAVVGEASQQHLETRQVRFGWLGRFLRWLGIAYRDTHPSKVIDYVARQIIFWKAEDLPAAKKIIEKIVKFQYRHPDALPEKLRTISSVYNRLRDAYLASNGSAKDFARFDLYSRPKDGPLIDGVPARLMTEKQIAAIAPAQLLKAIPYFADNQIALIPPSKMNAKVLNELDRKLAHMNEKQLRAISSKMVEEMSQTAIRRLTPEQLRSIQDKLDKAWFKKMDIPRQTAKLNGESLTAQQLIAMEWNAAKLQDSQLASCLNKMSIAELNAVSRSCFVLSDIQKHLKGDKLRQFVKQRKISPSFLPKYFIAFGSSPEEIEENLGMMDDFSCQPFRQRHFRSSMPGCLKRTIWVSFSPSTIARQSS